MARTEHHLFDHTLHEANTWLNEISDELNIPNQQTAYHALRGVLFAVRDRITVEEAMDFASQLPVLIRGIYFEGYRPAEKPEKYRTKEEFLQRVAEEVRQGGGYEPEKAVESVFQILNKHISKGQMDHIFSALPEGIIPVGVHSQ